MVELIFSRMHRFARFNGGRLSLMDGGGGRMLEKRLREFGVADYRAELMGNYSANPAATHRVYFGEGAARALHNRPLDLVRGYVWYQGKVPCVCTYEPQMAADFKNYEGDEAEDEESEGTGKDYARTKQSNYRFWLKADLNKLFRRDHREVPLEHVQLYSCEDAAAVLQRLPGDQLYLDIETNPHTNNLVCVGFSGTAGPIYTILPYATDGCGRGNPARLGMGLARAMANRQVVVHNAGFDLNFLALFYRIPFGQRISDTMLRHHRILQEPEKSLGHCISLWTNEPYHKDSAGTFVPRNHRQELKLATYNARDVHTMRLVWHAQEAFLQGKPAYRASVTQVEAMTYGYLLAGLQGICVDIMERQAAITKAENTMVQLNRMARILVGHDINIRSPKQLAEYLHDEMGYPQDGETASGNAPTGRLAIIKHLLANPQNAFLKLVLLGKKLTKTISDLKFNPYMR